MRFAKYSALASAVLVATSGVAHAAGFQVTEHSASGLGRAFAGEGVMAEDASVQAANAAGLAFLKGPVATGAMSYIDPDIDLNGRYSGAFALGQGGSRPANNDNVAPNQWVPAAYYAAPINEQWSWGVAAFTNFGLVTDYTADFGALALADKSDLKTANLNLNAAYRVNEWVAVGFGFNVVRAEAELTATVPANTTLPLPPQLGGPQNLSGRTVADLSGDDWGYGWNLGLVAEPVEGTRLGLSYRSSVDLSLEGRAKSELFAGTRSAVNPNALNFNSDASVDVELPAMWEASISQRINPDWSVQASAVRVEWDSFQELAFELDNGAPFPATPEHWENSWRYALGTTYQLDSAWTLRAGVLKDESPVADQHRTLRIPDSDRVWYTLGAGWKLSDALSIDAGYAYLDGDEADLNESTGSGRFTGEMSGSAQIVSMQANYRF